MIDRIIILVMDSVGVGEMPDAASYGDEGSNTVANICRALGGLKLPRLEELGFFEVVEGYPEDKKSKGVKIIGSYGKMSEVSPGKDTTTGHWEMAGIVLKAPFPTYPKGFPREIMERFEKAIGRKTVANKPASGTEIIKELGHEHVRTGHPIVYTSADSVFQIAAHESVIPLDELYEMCRKAREILQGEHCVGRVIARPFIGENGNFERTWNRRDFGVDPYGETLLDRVSASGRDVIAVGKIEDIFNGRGVTESVHTQGNLDGLEKTLAYIRKKNRGLIFTNLVDFDMLYGHRNDVKGYARSLEQFDRTLPRLMEAMRESDALFITADHGNDPTTPSTDHSREYVPVLVYGKNIRAGAALGIRNSFADLGQTALDILGLPALPNGESFMKAIL